MLALSGQQFLAADLNWLRQYDALAVAGYRVLALDLRGHGRGLRSSERFSLTDCADDAAALLDALGIASALVVGYSMGGPVTQLLARRHPDRVAGFVLCATAADFSDVRQKVLWRTMGGLRLLLGLFPRGVWTAGMRLAGAPSRESNWVASELSRGSARDVAEAGRELGRFDSSGWAGELPQPRAVVLTAEDRLVPPRTQQSLADALGVEPLVIDADHDACSQDAARFVALLQQALSGLRTPARRTA